MFLQGIKNRKFKTWETTRSRAWSEAYACKYKRKKEKRWGLMVHTTSRCCSPLISIASRLSIEHGRAGKVTSNCSFKNHIIQSLEQFIQRNRPTDIQTKKNITLKGTLHWYVEFLLLKYPLLVSFRLPHEDIILPKKNKKQKSDTQKTLLLQNWKK
jgi:hypothetical protein